MYADPEIAIGIGIILSLFFTETLGVTAGGVIVPGYIALYLHDPKMVLGTFAISLATYWIILFLSKFMLIYGKRRLVLSLLIGFFIGFWVKDNYTSGDLYVIGNIIPGLIASWMDRQGVSRTISVILITASIVYLSMMLLYKGVIYV
ncbi:MAG: poly-gamma-glutamate biosynthesis protein PgsC [Candidatus Marinimicrobia bacterium]|jgi:gamma-polyglutamate biosynthesis protein CapC|nr:poly-gamma-glutamate biosynthesis protein PgsC [Candidatus Neomarinimicrobiota bacterium]MBT5956930.1 poly-gamma-glutamate biosynthesis protein PgsC [Candidatus Neomarinimicrobiota bacterium]MBT6869853.1 poly-gamma-glutamate biosynthesis protein PgsC [Candidatus Neomarinimicrobiota bacterium]MBT7377671.1 poly-gamma-glutamate biosynthesis protein PgsC [Candidatus Neomarinimicrobiota bacterium]